MLSSRFLFLSLALCQENTRDSSRPPTNRKRGEKVETGIDHVCILLSLFPSLSCQLNECYTRTTHFNNKIQSRNSSLVIHTTQLQHPRAQSSASWCLPGLKATLAFLIYLCRHTDNKLFAGCYFSLTNTPTHCRS